MRGRDSDDPKRRGDRSFPAGPLATESFRTEADLREPAGSRTGRSPAGRTQAGRTQAGGKSAHTAPAHTAPAHTAPARTGALR